MPGLEAPCHRPGLGCPRSKIRGGDMPEVTKYAPGTPSWVDLGTSDPESAREFYSQVFGWEYEIGGEETGFYANCLVNGKRVAGLGGKMDPNMPTVWTTYI